jgi:hypothetical protein
MERWKHDSIAILNNFGDRIDGFPTRDDAGWLRAQRDSAVSGGGVADHIKSRGEIKVHAKISREK